MSKNKKIADDVLKGVGGNTNVASVTHCATRLRFSVIDSSLVKDEELKNVDGVLTVIHNGPSLQVVIGNNVKDVFEELNITETAEPKKPTSKKGFLDLFMDTISGVFTPIMVALSASGLLKAILLVASTAKWVSPESAGYQIFNVLADSVFYFLPILLAVSSAKKFKANTYIALLIVTALVHPKFIELFAGDPVSLFGMSIPKVSYASSVIPVIMSVYIQAKVETLFNKIIPNMLKTLLVPFLTIILVFPITLIVVGPIGVYVGNLLASGIMYIQNQFGWVAVGIVAFIRPVMVIFGMHYALLPITTASFAANGFEMLTRPATLTGTIAQGGAALAVGVKTKDREVKTMAYQTGLTALLGITEPAMYGINLKYKKPFYIALVSGGIGGLFAGYTGVKAISLGMTGVLTLPVFLGDTFKYAIYATVLTFVLSFVLTLLFGYSDEAVSENKKVEPKSNEKLVEKMVLPLSGKVIPIEEVKDAAFSSKSLGEGFAIIPNDGKVVSPVSGTVTALFPSLHAIGITADSGIEVLIHIGLDTVNLAGEGFTPFIAQGDRVSKGQKIMEVNLPLIESKGYSTVTPVVITKTNGVEYTFE